METETLENNEIWKELRKSLSDYLFCQIDKVVKKPYYLHENWNTLLVHIYEDLEVFLIPNSKKSVLDQFYLVWKENNGQ